MTITTTTHLNFRGEARDALAHYRDVFGGDLVVVTYADLGGDHDPDEAAAVVWGQVTSPAGFSVMAYDVPSARPFDRGRDAVFVSVRGTDPDEVTACFRGLADEAAGARVREPLGPSAFSPLYGMVTDRFGITWVLDVAVARA